MWFALPILASALVVVGAEIVFEGRLPTSFPTANLDASNGPYLTVVKGSKNATQYTQLVSTPPTPLWNPGHPSQALEKTMAVSIDNSSIFVGQNGFRRTELLAQKNWSPSELNEEIQHGNTSFHFSIQADEKKRLNYKHEYQVVFIEPGDGSHVFGVQLGSPFTNPTGPLPAPNAYFIKVLDHALNVLFTAPFSARTWHNFAVRVDWDSRTLQVFYSVNAGKLRAVSKVVPNLTNKEGKDGRGDFHIGLLKLPIVNPKDTAENQGDVVHYGIQEGTTEGLLYSGVFIERV